MQQRVAVSLVFLTVGCVGTSSSGVDSYPTTPRPIAAQDTVFIEDMTWMEVRDALAAGKTTAIVGAGGIEQNGPYLALGKHNLILRATTEAIARRLGDSLVAPIIPFVPEGAISPPTGHMRFPGTISVSEEAYERLLIDICASLRQHGFRHIILLGDSGGNQAGMQAVAKRLNAQWAGGGTHVHFIAEYYDYPEVARWLDSQGVRERDEGLHDDFAVTAQMMVVDPNSVRMRQRLAAGNFRINGIDLSRVDDVIQWGDRIIEFRADVTVAAIRRQIQAVEGQMPKRLAPGTR